MIWPCGGMADAADSKSAGLKTHVSSTLTTATSKLISTDGVKYVITLFWRNRMKYLLALIISLCMVSVGFAVQPSPPPCCPACSPVCHCGPHCQCHKHRHHKHHKHHKHGKCHKHHRHHRHGHARVHLAPA